uniref:DNA-directed RNA polymerase III subunit RPC9 n=1 Tax=Chromera velia CCMP2878 TaxID=1169474 RepID=A0A0G4HPH7_9ALVE|mmetsp:Transcript_17610/g.35735  ORF Transcript_17610/g.35735 Transcript_17610/m.35735 type:complete len:153 (-) Transcript_17610:109-567(-)|eukprot:Cvel_7775.t1-p1 / transcript=Cvel_7775.t1 / gene=Cvel_7775 / organism=Chromera_velia_CCMP2878 / gene_product=hypothetical protein / transcript_product=hypothetical protein / location=Cvel_scaffold414:62205-62660(+) / protein_length=152 / sequence_SO=supercontig / SO=protein_coding / is_pseudo=false
MMRPHAKHSGWLTNFEVLQILQQSSIEDDPGKLVDANESEMRVGISKRMLTGYITTAQPETKIMTDTAVVNLAKELRSRFTLTEAEILQFLNLLPKTTVEVFSIVEEIESRFSQEQWQEMCDCVQKHISPRSDLSEDAPPLPPPHLQHPNGG